MCQPDPDQQPRLFVDPGEDRRGYVYLLIAHTRAAFKVGYTADSPRRRGGELRRDGQMLCWWPGDQFDERRLHHELEPYRLPGNREWFEVRAATMPFLLGQCQRYDFPQGVRLLQALARECFPGLVAA